MSTNEHGVPLAEKVDAFVLGERFGAVVDANEFTLDDLDYLSPFWACRIPPSLEEC